MSGMNIQFSISAVDNFSDTMSNLNSQTEKAFQAVGQIGAAVTAFGIGAAAGLGMAVKSSADFEAQLSRVGAIAEATDAELAGLRQSALQLGASTSKSATEIAQGQEALAALGFTTNDIIGAMPGVISAAEASGSDMAQTAEVMASTLNIFGMEASKATKVADLLAKTANVSAADLTDMQYALKYAGPPAAALGVSLEELSASIGIMTNAGMGGEQAGTTLRGALLSLLNPSEQNAKLMDAMGIAVTDASGNFVGLSGLVENLSASMEGMTDTQKAAALAQIVGTEAVSGMLSLMAAGPAEIDKMTESLRNSGGASAEAAAKMKDNLKGAVDELFGAFETMAITIGTALTPAVQVLVGFVQKLADAFNGLPSYMQTTLAVLAALTATLALFVGPILLIVSIIPALTAGFTAIAGAIGITAGALAGIIGIVAGVVAALVAIGVGLVVAYNKVEWFRAMVDDAWAKIKEYFNVALTFIKGIVSQVMDVVSAYIGEKLAQIKKFWAENGDMIMKAASNVFNVIKTVITTVMDAIWAVMQFIWPAVKFLIVSTWEAIKGVIDGALNIIMGVVKAFAALFTGNWGALWDAIKQIIMGALEFVWNLISLIMMGKIVGVVKSFASLVTGLFTSFWTAIKSLFSSSTNAISSVVTTVFNAMKSIINASMNGISGIISGVWSIIKSIFTTTVNTVRSLVSSGFSGMLSSVTSIMGSIRTFIRSTWDNIIAFFRNIDLYQIGKNIIQGLLNGISSMAGALMDKAKSIASSITDTISGVLQIKSPSRVMVKLGEYTGEGFLKGLSGMVRDVKSVSGNIAMGATPVINNGSSIASRQFLPQPQQTSATPVILQAVLPNGKVLAEASYDDINRLLYRDMRQAERTGGDWKR